MWMMNNEIRPVVQQDLEALKEVIISTDLFPVEELDEMISDYLENPTSDQIWMAFILNKVPVAFAFCSPEKFTDGTYNLLAIAVLPKHQGLGIGQQLVKQVEELLAAKQKRVLIVETSSGENFVSTRKFYQKLGYTKEASIREFWKAGEDKVVYWKKLT